MNFSLVSVHVAVSVRFEMCASLHFTDGADAVPVYTVDLRGGVFSLEGVLVRLTVLVLSVKSLQTRTQGDGSGP